MGHQGGWPLNIFLNAQGRALLRRRLSAQGRAAGPARLQPRARPTWPTLYRDKPDEVAQNAQAVFEQLANLLDRDMRGPAGSHPARRRRLRIGQRFDIFFGGMIGST